MKYIAQPQLKTPMINQDDESISSIGSGLLSHAQEFGEPNRLPLITQLFPFVLLASRRMTMREMSAWLDNEKGVKLSPAMITKGLKRPDLHLSRIAEHVEPLAAYIVAVYHHLGETAESLLFDNDPETRRSMLDVVWEIASHDPDGISEGVHEAFQTLWEVWVPIPEEVQFMCRPYFYFSANSSIEDSDDDDSPQSSPKTNEL